MKSLIKSISIALLYFCLAFFTQAQAITVEQLQQQLTKYPTFKADFVLQKRVTNLNIPFATTGKIIIDRKLGVWCQQTSPFSQTILANQDRIKITTGDGPDQLITRAAKPQLFEYSKLVNAFFSGDMKTLNENFTMVIKDLNATTWQLQLTPKSAALSKSVQKIVIEGEKFPETIELNDAKNGKTMIVLTNHDTSSLTEQQKRLFN